MKLEKLESLRGFSAIYVVLHHLISSDLYIGGVNLGLLFRFGQEAVILFFLLSGFVIHYSFMKKKNKDFKSYFLSRFYRIYIPLLLIMLLGYLNLSFKDMSFKNIEVGNLILNLFMLQDISSLKPNVIVDPYMGNSPLWSLSYEWWFYMMYFPINKYVPSNIKNFIVLLLTSISSIIYYFEPEFLSRLFMYFSIWWAGVILADTYLKKSDIRLIDIRWPVVILFTVCSINLFSCYMFFQSEEAISIGVHPILELRHHLFALFVVIAAVIWKHQKWYAFDFIFKPFLPLASISYVIYILMLIVFSYIIEKKVYPLILIGIRHNK